MFGSKTGFGAGSTGFGTPSTSLFSQNKPVGVSFGTPQTVGTGGLFGSGAASTPAPGSLFGTTAVSSTGGSLFGATGAFGQPSTAGTGLFGSSGASKPTLFGGATGTGGGGIFGGATATPGSSLFGSSTQPAGTGLFGSGGGAPSGTTVKFDPPINQDTMMKNNIQASIQTKHMCITAMKAYEAKSLEELRVEDYLANRKGGGASTGFAFGSTTQQAPAGTTGLFGQPAAASTAAPPSLFGGTQQKSLFGSSGTSTGGGGLFGQPTGTGSGGGLFGGQKSLFGSTPATSSTAGFAFSTPFSATTTTQSGGLFGAKPVCSLLPPFLMKLM